SNNVSIARSAGSTGTVVMSGGLLSAIGQQIYVGREGNGQMTLSGGTAKAADLLVAADVTNTASGLFTMTGGSLDLSRSLFVGGASFSTGQVFMSGGTISVSAPGGGAILSVPNGSMTLSRGTLATDSLQLTNTTGHFTFNGGSLITKGTTVANGAPFIVGNG